MPRPVTGFSRFCSLLFALLCLLAVHSARAQDQKVWEARAIVGYRQAGASSAKFSQNFFFGFFIMRNLSYGDIWDKSHLNLWCDLGVASCPQQVTARVAAF